MPLEFRRIGTSSIRESIAGGKLPEVDHGLLKSHGDKLGWSTEDKARFCNLCTEVLEAKQEHMRLEVHVRSLCHAAQVVADHLAQNERFNTKKTVLLIGDVGIVPQPWAGLIQPAVYLHQQGFNIVSIEVPELATSTPRWLKLGPAVLSETLKYLNIRSVHALACGNGGAVFLEAMGYNREAFGSTHFVYNIDCPPGTKKAPFPIFKIEEYMRKGDLQFWFGYSDEEGVYNRHEDGTPKRSAEAIRGMQQRLEGERRRGRRSLDFDEVLVSDALNSSKSDAQDRSKAKVRRVNRITIGRNKLFAFSDELLESLGRFLSHAPYQGQEELEETGGLITGVKVFGNSSEQVPELPALQFLRLDPDARTLVLLADQCGPVRTYCRRVERKREKAQKALVDMERKSSVPSLTGGSLSGRGSRAGSAGTPSSRGSRTGSQTGSRSVSRIGSHMSRTSSASALFGKRPPPELLAYLEEKRELFGDEFF